MELLATNGAIFWLELQLRLQRLLPLLYQCQVIDIHGISQGLELFVVAYYRKFAHSSSPVAPFFPH